MQYYVDQKAKYDSKCSGRSSDGASWYATLAVAVSLLGCQTDRSSAVLTKTDPTALAPVPAVTTAQSATSSNLEPSGSGERVSSTTNTTEPTTLLTDESSAYAATLRVDEDAIYLLTSTIAYRIVPGEAIERFPLDLSFGATINWSSIVFWSRGGIYAAPKRGGKPSRLGILKHQPQYFVTSGNYLVWLDRTEAGLFSLQTLEEKRPRVLYTAAGKIDAMTMLHDWIFFVERAPNESWRLGGISVKGGSPSFTTEHRGRTPAMLVASSEIYYYDPDAEALRMLTPDLQREETIAKQLVCSPFAVSTAFYCAQVEGIFALTRGSRQRRELVRDPRRTVASIAANSRYLVWVSDTGANRLGVNMLSVAGAAAK